MPEQGVSSQGHSLRCRPPPHPSVLSDTQHSGCLGPAAPRGRATQLLPAMLPLTPLEKGSMGLGCTREGVIPGRGKSFIQPLAEAPNVLDRRGHCKNPRHPVTSQLSWEHWQDTPCLPPSCPQAMRSMLGILAQGWGASPCSSLWSRSGAAPNPHLGGRGRRGGRQPKGVDKEAG